MTRCNREKGSHRRGSISRRASRRLSSLPFLRRSSLSLSLFLVYLFFPRLSSPFGRSVMLAFLDLACLARRFVETDISRRKGTSGKIRLFFGGKKGSCWPLWKGCCRSFFYRRGWSVITINSRPCVARLLPSD